jgi:cytochrome c oxidase subunit III
MKTTVDEILKSEAEKEAELLAEQPRLPLSMNPKMFLMWLFIVSIVMIFASMTSAYLVRKAEGNWLEFDVPSLFWLNSAIILASTLTMQFAWFAARKDNLNALKISMILTVLLGIGFLVGQWYSWVALVQARVFFVGNPAGSFMYVLTGLHAFHLISGLVFLVLMTIQAFRLNVHAKNMLWISICTTYWHFLTALWLYLFAFILLNH